MKTTTSDCPKKNKHLRTSQKLLGLLRIKLLKWVGMTCKNDVKVNKKFFYYIAVTFNNDYLSNIIWILGPFLFIIYLNDIFPYTTETSSSADDTKELSVNTFIVHKYHVPPEILFKRLRRCVIWTNEFIFQLLLYWTSPHNHVLFNLQALAGAVRLEGDVITANGSILSGQLGHHCTETTSIDAENTSVCSCPCGCLPTSSRHR